MSLGVQLIFFFISFLSFFQLNSCFFFIFLGCKPTSTTTTIRYHRYESQTNHAQAKWRQMLLGAQVIFFSSFLFIYITNSCLFFIFLGTMMRYHNEPQTNTLFYVIIHEWTTLPVGPNDDTSRLFFVFFSFYSTNYKCDRTNPLVNIFQREIVVFGIARSGNLSGRVFITI